MRIYRTVSINSLNYHKQLKNPSNFFTVYLKTKNIHKNELSERPLYLVSRLIHKTIKIFIYKFTPHLCTKNKSKTDLF